MIARLAPVLAALALLAGLAFPAAAHETRPAYLEITAKSDGRYEVVWKRPMLGSRVLSLAPRIAPACTPLPPRSRIAAGAALSERWHIRCGGKGLAGRTLTIDGLKFTITDVLVRLDHGKGATESVILRPASAAYTIKGAAGWAAVARDYLVLGIEHILGGVDHLLFVLCLLLLVEGGWRLVKTITAFTVAHSLTLAAAALGLVSVPQRAVEAVIALSIVFLATEIVKERSGGRPSLTRQRPWLIAFIFGLLHGFGFAGALSEVGLPQGEIPMALLAFNVGVEVGQLLFIAAVLAVIWVWRRLDIRAVSVAAANRVAAYLIGSVAAYWLIDRVSGIAA